MRLPFNFLFLNSFRKINNRISPMFYFFLDIGVIRKFEHSQDTSIQAFLLNPENKFFCTESVWGEMQTQHDFITLVDSKIGEYRMRLFRETLEEALNARADEHELTPLKMKQFKELITHVVEAGYACYRPLPKGDLREPPFVTDRQDFISDVIRNPVVSEILEATINRVGFEHLITVTSLESQIEQNYGLSSELCSVKTHGC